MKSSLRFGVLLALILLAGVIVNAWSYLGEARVERKDLNDFPQRIGAWQRTGSDRGGTSGKDEAKPLDALCPTRQSRLKSPAPTSSASAISRPQRRGTCATAGDEK